MDAADPISLLDPLPVEVTDTGRLNYWESNLREVLEQSNDLLQGWIDAAIAPDLDSRVEVWGPPPQTLRSPVSVPGSSEHQFQPSALIVRFPDPTTLTEATLAHMSKRHLRLYVVQRAPTSLDRLAPPTGGLAAHSPTLALRSIHLFTPYTLQRHAEVSKRGVRLHVAEFAPTRGRSPITDESPNG